MHHIYNRDALSLCRRLPESSVDLIATDPPYFNVKRDAWDRQWDDIAAFIAWLEEHLRAFRRVLKPNGSLYVFASPQMVARVEVAVGTTFNVLNHIVWSKPSGRFNATDVSVLRGYFPQTERVIFADQYAEGQKYKDREYEQHAIYKPLKDWFRARAHLFGITGKALNEAMGTATTGSGLAGMFIGSKVGFHLPTVERYEQMQAAFPEAFNRPYDGLRREYEDLRREYEDLRRTFNATSDAPYTDVWAFPTVNAYKGKHPCEKPLDMMRHIVRTSSRPGDVVLDPFCGSGATLDAAKREGRRYIGGDFDPKWCEFARRRLSAT